MLYSLSGGHFCNGKICGLHNEAPPIATDVIGSNLEATDFVVGLSIYQRNSCIMVNFLMNVFASIYGKDVWKMCQIRILSFYPCWVNTHIRVFILLPSFSDAPHWVPAFVWRKRDKGCLTQLLFFCSQSGQGSLLHMKVTMCTAANAVFISSCHALFKPWTHIAQHEINIF